MTTPTILLLTATIPASGTVSSAVAVNKGQKFIGIQMPTAFTGTAVTIKNSVDGTTFQTVYDPVAGADLSYKAAASKFVKIPLTDQGSYNSIQIVSNATEAAARKLTLAFV